MLQQFRSSCKKGPVGRVGCIFIMRSTPYYLWQLHWRVVVGGRERFCRSSNIASWELSIPNESTMQIEKCWIALEKKNRLLQLIRKIVVAHKFQLPSTVKSRQNQLWFQNIVGRRRWKDRASCHLGSPTWLPKPSRCARWHRHIHAPTALHPHASPW